MATEAALGWVYGWYHHPSFFKAFSIWFSVQFWPSDTVLSRFLSLKAYTAIHTLWGLLQGIMRAVKMLTACYRCQITCIYNENSQMASVMSSVRLKEMLLKHAETALYGVNSIMERWDSKCFVSEIACVLIKVKIRLGRCMAKLVMLAPPGSWTQLGQVPVLALGCLLHVFPHFLGPISCLPTFI